ncbi:MAG: hypothetical protein QXX95_08140 [Nitrososphaerales archaeon]
MIFIGSIVVFFFIVPLPDLLEGRIGSFITAIFKALLAVLLVSGFTLLLREVSYRALYFMLRRKKKI